MSEPHRRRSGLTMIEVLAVLGLLALLIPAAMNWTMNTSRLHRESSAHVAWHAAASAALQVIHDDLQSGDFLPGSNQRRVVVVEGILLIQTRDRGPVVHRYEWSAIDRTLWRIDARDDEEQSQLLLGEIASFQVQLNFEEQWLEVQLVGNDDTKSASRRYRV